MQIKYYLKNSILWLIICYFIALGISLIVNDGHFHMTSPLLVKAMNSELNAVLFQTFMVALMGALVAWINGIWQLDISIVKQTLLHYLGLLIVIGTGGTLLYWTEHSWLSIMIFIISFTFVYLIVWISQYLRWKHIIKKANEAIK